jgi:beta-lactamase regulating signal transducer with metallopeptidase domain
MEAFSMRLLPLFDWLLWTTIQAALLFCLIMLVQFVLRSRLSIRWHYCLWLLLLIRLAIPWLPESKISVFNLVPRSIQQGGILESYSKPQSSYGMGFYRYSQYDDATEPQQQAFSVRFMRMLPLLWLFGTVVLAVYVGAGNFRLWWLVTRERPLTDQKILDLLEDCKAEMGIRNILGIVITDKVKSPALFGFLRPRLLLPAGMIETLSREELRYVFLHELGHLKRRDIYIGWLMSFLQVLHWFNPLVWLAFYRMQTDRELACDALVLARLSSGGLTRTHGGESKDYGRTIVNLLERFSRPQRLPSMAGILETKSQLKRRIKMIAKFKKTSRPRWAGAMLLLAGLACIVLTNAYVAKADFTFGIPTNIGPIINSPHSDYPGSFSSDGLEMYFDSNRSGGNWDSYDIYVSKRTTTDDPWGAPVKLGPPFSSSTVDACAIISTDGLSLYFSSLNRAGGYGSLDTWVVTRATVSDAWGEPSNLGPTINTSQDEVATSISSDGLVLYFLRKQPPNGPGDIYMSRRPTTNDAWGESVKLGPTVNSSYDDNYACISPNGLLLFFSSNRPGGFGSMDLWVTTRAAISEPWGAPVNLGPEINSSGFDAGPVMSPDGLSLYFGSERPGGSLGGDDIWQARILPVLDFNGDGKVDLKDFRKLAQYWGQNEPTCDIAPLPSGDGIVDEKDLNLFAEHLLKELQPIAHWKLDETEGEIAKDSIGNNDGTLNGSPVWQSSGGAVAGALQFDGIDDYISTTFSISPINGSFSVFTWIKGGAPGQAIICQTGGINISTRWLWADPSYGRLMTWLMHPTYDPLVSEKVITDGHWHHVGLVYDIDRLHRYLYVDGREVAKDTDYVGVVDSNGGLFFGASKTLDTAAFWSGLIDDIRIYDEVLSADEVADLVR